MIMNKKIYFKSKLPVEKIKERERDRDRERERMRGNERERKRKKEIITKLYSVKHTKNKSLSKS